MAEKHDDDSTDRMVHGYENMMERAQAFIEQARRDTLPSLREAIGHGVEKAVEFGELSRAEAERVGEYLHRDIEDAAAYLSETGRGIADWLHFDFEFLEARIKDALSVMTDQTRLELDRLAEQARRSTVRHTGEITGPGTLRCTGCGRTMRFRSTGHIPPCPACRSTEFERVTRSGE